MEPWPRCGFVRDWHIGVGTYGQMPAAGPPYFTAAQVAEIAGWIDAGCPV